MLLGGEGPGSPAVAQLLLEEKSTANVDHDLAHALQVGIEQT